MAGIRKHWKRWLIVAVAAIAVLATAGPHAYINYIKDDPPAALTLDSTPASPQAPSGGAAGSGNRPATASAAGGE